MMRSFSTKPCFFHRSLGAQCRGIARPLLRQMIPGWIILACTVNPYPLFADDIILKNGKVIEGTAETLGDRVLVRPWSSSATLTLRLDQIREIVPKERPKRETRTPDEEAADASPEALGENDSKPDEEDDGPFSHLRKPKEKKRDVPPMPEIEYFYLPEPDSQVRAAIETVFPRIVRVCVEDFGMTFDGYIPLRIEIIHDTAEYEAVGNTLPGHQGMQTNGFYNRLTKKITLRGDKLRGLTVATLYHEATHDLLDREFGYAPIWLTEGMAEYFENFRVHGRNTVIVDQRAQDYILRQALIRDEVIPLSNYLQLADSQWIQYEYQGELKTRARMIGWSLISYILTDDVALEAFREYLRALRDSSPNRALRLAYHALDTSYPGGVESLERKWRRWALQVGSRDIHR